MNRSRSQLDNGQHLRKAKKKRHGNGLISTSCHSHFDANRLWCAFRRRHFSVRVMRAADDDSSAKRCVSLSTPDALFIHIFIKKMFRFHLRFFSHSQTNTRILVRRKEKNEIKNASNEEVKGEKYDDEEKE